jgi:hypothetical protein
MTFLVLQQLMSGSGRVKQPGETLLLSQEKAEALVLAGKIMPFPEDDSALLSGKCAYKLATPYGQVWLVADDQAKGKLLADGVQEAVYTIAEAQEFIRLAVEQRPYVHMVKQVMGGIIESVSPFKPTETQPRAGSIQTRSVDAQGQVMDTRTATKDTFKYRVLKPLELHGKSYLPGDVLELPVDEAQGLLQDGTVQATSYWARSNDLSSEGYR